MPIRHGRDGPDLVGRRDVPVGPRGQRGNEVGGGYPDPLIQTAAASAFPEYFLAPAAYYKRKGQSLKRNNARWRSRSSAFRLKRGVIGRVTELRLDLFRRRPASDQVTRCCRGY
jgi:hypothetical protein